MLFLYLSGLSNRLTRNSYNSIVTGINTSALSGNKSGLLIKNDFVSSSAICELLNSFVIFNSLLLSMYFVFSFTIYPGERVFLLNNLEAV